MKKKAAGIYEIQHTESGRIYIGSSMRLEYRLVEHRRELNNGTHHNPKLLRAWRKYGEEAFRFSVIEIVNDLSLLLEREQFYIDTLKPYYNCATDAYATFTGREHTEETKEKMRQNHGGFHGRHTAEARAKMSAAAKGCQNFLGKRHTKDSLEKMSAAQLGRTHTAETKAKQSARRKEYWQANPVTDEERERRRQRQLGKKRIPKE